MCTGSRLKMLLLWEVPLAVVVRSYEWLFSAIANNGVFNGVDLQLATESTARIHSNNSVHTFNKRFYIK